MILHKPYKLSYQQGGFGEMFWVGIISGEMVGPWQISDDIWRQTGATVQGEAKHFQKNVSRSMKKTNI